MYAQSSRMHEDIDTEGVIPASVGASVPDLPVHRRQPTHWRQPGPEPTIDC